MKNHGTIWLTDVPDDSQFNYAVEQAVIMAARRFGYGAPLNDQLDVDVKFLACSGRGDVYMVHVTDHATDQTASARLTQMAVRHGDRQVPLGTAWT